MELNEADFSIEKILIVGSQKQRARVNKGQRCAYCKKYRSDVPDRKFFRFPVNEDLRKKWLEACNIPFLFSKTVQQLTANVRLCSEHFFDSDYASSKRHYLRASAVPHFDKKSINPRKGGLITEMKDILKEKLRNGASLNIMEVDTSVGESTKNEEMDIDKECIDQTSPTRLETSDSSDNKEIKKEVEEGDNSSNIQQSDISDNKENKEVKDNNDSSNVQQGDISDNKESEKEVKESDKSLKTEQGDEKVQPESNSMEAIQLGVEGAEEDDNEKRISLSPDEVKQYLIKKIGEYINTSINPVHSLRSRVTEVERSGNENYQEFTKLYKALQLMERKQEIFLRKIDVLPKVTMSHASVSAQLPLQPVAKAESPVIPKELSITKIDAPPSNKAPSLSSNQTNSLEKSTSKPLNIECIDLTDDTELPQSSSASKATSYPSSMLRHPAPLPPRPFSGNAKIPPKPRLKISAEDRGIVLQWDMPPNQLEVTGFDIFGYQEQKAAAINTLLWKKIGHVKAMSLPMACTLTQFVDGNRYHFSIRAVDVNGRCGHYSDAISIVYKQKASLKK